MTEFTLNTVLGPKESLSSLLLVTQSESRTGMFMDRLLNVKADHGEVL